MTCHHLNPQVPEDVHMVRNSHCPKIEADPETYRVAVDGEHVTCKPARVLPLAQRYFLR
jgi:urease subunit alpha